MLNYSFWADEAYLAGISSGLIQNTLSINEAFAALNYQKLYILFVAISFKIFGVSEISARIPSLIFFLLGIVIIFLLAKKISNTFGAILSTFIYAFSHLNLAYATQAKPYSLLETITLSVIFLLLCISKEKNKMKLISAHLVILLLLTVATLSHTIGILIWVIYLGYFATRLVCLKVKIHRKYYVFFVLGIVLFAILFFPIFTAYSSFKIFQYNNAYQVIKLFLYKYSLITISATIGFIWIFKKNMNISIGILLYIISILILAMFQQYIFNIRYVLTIFGVVFFYFGIFWGKVGERYDNNLKFSILNLKLSGKAIIPLTVLVLLYATGYKIVRWPQAYYNPNIDKYGDVQIANYKDFYSKLKTQFPQYKKLYVVNNIFDVEALYFGRYANAYFMKNAKEPHKHNMIDVMVYESLDDFKKIMEQHPQGLLIMEDWQSFLPDEVKEYAKKNLKLEFRVESLKEAPDDPWPLALYSWGL